DGIISYVRSYLYSNVDTGAINNNFTVNAGSGGNTTTATGTFTEGNGKFNIAHSVSQDDDDSPSYDNTAFYTPNVSAFDVIPNLYIIENLKLALSNIYSSDGNGPDGTTACYSIPGLSVGGTTVWTGI